ncbi:G patch domain-containing protein 11 [Actinomortierella ambigua]|uniref:G patch domain-containing protein 11 n=1 Tax=Actinomortierella ambigua TaxID=1343610 RepID=A0A9P6QBA9_9FUNG|nr:G patch domain-containing protein 11 [Actinomortierella ambigua]
MADDDDYMSEAFLAQFEEAEKTSKKNKTYTERRREKEREHLANHIKSHKERELESRTKGLETELGEENKGMQMLLKMGFKKGGTLGASTTGKTGTTTLTAPEPADAEQGSPLSSSMTNSPSNSSTTNTTTSLRAPLAIEIKQGRGGLGMDTLLREQEDQMLQEKQAFDQHFRERKGDQYLHDKHHRQLTRAQSLCMELDTALFRKKMKMMDNAKEQQEQGHDPSAVLSRGNAFWWISDDVPDDLIGTRAMGPPAETGVSDDMEQEQEEESPPPLWGEYPEFASLEVLEKRDKVVDYLRAKHAYCFWCHAQYDDQTDLQEHCPGASEDDH